MSSQKASDLGNHPQEIIRDEFTQAYANMFTTALFIKGQILNNDQQQSISSINNSKAIGRNTKTTVKSHYFFIASKRIFHHVRKSSKYTKLKKKVVRKTGQ